MATTTTQEYIAVFTHHRGGGSSASMFRDMEHKAASKDAKQKSLAHDGAKVEVVRICQSGQRILETWSGGKRDKKQRWIPYAPAVAALALALALAVLPALPSGCSVVERTTSEGFPVAECADGREFYRDMDGQPYVTPSGAPAYLPGMWVESNA